MISGTLKLFSIAAILLLNSSPHRFPPQYQASTNLICTEAAPLNFDNSFYQDQTRKSLERLGEDNHPVGLYWLAHRDLRGSKTKDAISKLQYAAQQGLADAYFQLANIYLEQKKEKLAAQARHCGNLLITRTKDYSPTKTKGAQIAG